MPTLFLDCDGVLADFDAGATAALGMPPREFERRFGLGRFWSRLARTADFYASLPELPDARTLFNAVAHLEPVILTGCPRGGWAEAQKTAWAARRFPGTRIITCMARDKRDHAAPGDILVDDTLKHRHLWEEIGGIFIHHRTAAETIAELKRRFPQLFEDRLAAGDDPLGHRLSGVGGDGEPDADERAGRRKNRRVDADHPSFRVEARSA